MAAATRFPPADPREWLNRARSNLRRAAVRAADSSGGVSGVIDTFGGAPRVIVADRFGHIYHVEDGGPAHALSEPRELEEWLRFIGTQCPE
jgi:hypothetical protein